MPTFSYQAVDTQGRAANGAVSAGDRSAAVDLVLGQGLQPVKVEEKAAGANGHGVASWIGGARVSRTAAEAFVRELGNLLTAGVSLSRSLEILMREASSPAAERMCAQIRGDVVDGASLAQAMGRFPNVFPPVNVAMVRAGEEGGFLEVVLAQIASFRARERELTSRVKAAMIYPAILMALMAGVLIFLLTYFIPKFRTIFANFGESLPALTQTIIALSNVVREYGPVLLVAGVLAVVALRRLLSTDAGRRKLQQLTLATPGLGTVTARFALVRFARLLGTLIDAGVPMMSALRTARDAIGNQLLHDAVSRSIDEVQKGQPLSRSLADCPMLFPASVMEMIAVAEETGRLGEELVRIADTYESDLDRRLRNLVAMLEPVLLMVMASVVGTIVRAKPSGVKGQLIKTATIATTMGPGIKLDVNSLQELAAAE